MTTNVRLALLEEQKRLGENDTEFSRRLGIERSYWTHIRLGRSISPSLAQRAVQLFPPLLHAHVKDLQEPLETAV